MTEDLLAFLRARLDEVEAAARACPAGPWRIEESPATHDSHPGYRAGVVVDAAGTEVISDKYREVGPQHDHLVRHDPSRVLREVVAGRRLIDEFDKARAWVMTEEDAVAKIAVAGMCTAWECAVKIRASVYSDQPDYRQEWAP